MQRLRKTIPILAAAWLLAAAPSLAEIRCKMDETLMQCWEKANEKDLASQQSAELKAKDTGIDTGGASLASNTTNLLSLLTMSGLASGSDDGDNEGVYTIDLNFLIPGLGKDNNSKLQMVVNSKPTVADSVKTALTKRFGDASKDTVTNLQEGLGDLDDFTLSFTYSAFGKRRGRGFRQYHDRFATLTNAVPSAFDSMDAGKDAMREFGNFFDEHQDQLVGVPDDPLAATFDQIAGIAGEATTLALKSRFEAWLNQERPMLEADRKAMKMAGLESFADLLDNQPQLLFTAQKKSRDPSVGGDETSYKLTYEWGMANFNNAMSADCHRQMDTTRTFEAGDPTPANCLAQYSSWVARNKDSMDKGTRFSFSAEYVDIDRQTVLLPNLDGAPADPDPLVLDGAQSLVISAGWSRQFQQAGGGKPLSLDFVGKYEDVSNDPMRRDRGVATLTVTRKFGDITVPFGIVFANHGRYLGEVDEELNAHFGIKFDLNTKGKGE